MMSDIAILCNRSTNLQMTGRLVWPLENTGSVGAEGNVNDLGVAIVRPIEKCWMLYTVQNTMLYSPVSLAHLTPCSQVHLITRTLLQASQRSGATTVFRGPTSPSRPGHDLSALVPPGLRSAGLEALQVPTGDRWLPILVVVQEMGIYSAVFPAVRSNLVIVCLNICTQLREKRRIMAWITQPGSLVYHDVISASQTEVL
jgi:hypothetical protein